MGMEVILFSGLLRWFAMEGSHLREMQMAWIFGNDKVTIQHLLRLKRYPR